MSAGAADRLCAIGTRLAFGLAGTWSVPRLPILIFHRVLKVPDPLFPGEIDAARFDRLMGLVARSFHVLTFGQAVERLRSDTLSARSLVITFDDGYADNAEIALPILQRHGLAATFFVSSGFLDGGRMWNDTVIECLRRTPHQRIDLADFGLGCFDLTSADARRAAIEALLPRVKYLSLAARESSLVHLHALAAAPDLPSNLMMRAAQVMQLQRAGMEIGAHTVGHPILAELSDADAEAEIEAGRRHLQSLLGTAVDVFAYPNGRPGRDYDARHVAMLRKLGFRGAASTASGVASGQSDLYQLPRFTPWDRQPHRWAARLLWHGLRGAEQDVVGVAT